MAHIHQELGSSTSARKHRAHNEDHIDKTTAERLQVSRCGWIATNVLCAIEQPRIHGDWSTIVGKRSFVVLIDVMVLKEVDVTICQFFAIHLLNAVAEQTTIQTNKALFRKFANKCGDVLILYVSIRIVLRTCSRIRRVAVVDKETQFICCLTIVFMALAIKHKSFSHLVVMLSHKGNFYLILHILYAHAIAVTQTLHDAVKGFSIDIFALALESLDNSRFNFFYAQRLGCAVTLSNDKVVGAHKWGLKVILIKGVVLLWLSQNKVLKRS